MQLQGKILVVSQTKLLWSEQKQIRTIGEWMKFSIKNEQLLLTSADAIFISLTSQNNWSHSNRSKVTLGHPSAPYGTRKSPLAKTKVQLGVIKPPDDIETFAQKGPKPSQGLRQKWKKILS